MKFRRKELLSMVIYLLHLPIFLLHACYSPSSYVFTPLSSSTLPTSLLTPLLTYFHSNFHSPAFPPLLSYPFNSPCNALFYSPSPMVRTKWYGQNGTDRIIN